MTVAAIGSLIFGLAFLLVPGTVMSLYGIAYAPNDMYPRFFGSALLGFATILWIGRKVTSGPALRGILIGSFIASIIGLVIAIIQALNGTGNVLVWSTVLIYFLLSIGFGDFIFRTPPPK